MESMEQEMMKPVAALQKGDMVRGVVVAVRPDEVFVDIGNKSEGQINKRELTLQSDASNEDVVKVGDEIEVMVLDPDTDGTILLSKVQADAVMAWTKLQQVVEHDSTLEVKVIAQVKGGLTVDVFGIRGFMPASQTDLHRVEDISGFIGQAITVKVIELEQEKKRVVVSRRKVLEEQRAAQEAQRYAEISAGQQLSGTVSRLASFGAFVDIGGVEGLIHISELSWNRVKNPAEVVQVGDAVKVTVLKVDAAAKRLSLSLRDTTPDPWLVAAASLSEGAIMNGKVSKLADFGAFVAIAPGVEGLVHVSEITDQHIKRPADVLSVEQEVAVKIVGIDRAAKRLSLSIKAAVEQKEKEEYKEFIQEEAGLHSTIGDKFAELAKMLK